MSVLYAYKFGKVHVHLYMYLNSTIKPHYYGRTQFNLVDDFDLVTLLQLSASLSRRPKGDIFK